MAKNYLSVVYDEKSHPYNDYPKKLCAYLFQCFNLKKGMKMLEPGCGRGEFLNNFKELGLDVVGIDISSEAANFDNGLDVKICDVVFRVIVFGSPSKFQNACTGDVFAKKSFSRACLIEVQTNTKKY